jgi:hypothetical protein
VNSAKADHESDRFHFTDNLIWDLESITKDFSNSLRMLVDKGKLSSNDKVAVEVGFKNEALTACESETSSKLTSFFSQAVDTEIPASQRIALDDAKLLYLYSDSPSDVGDFKVDKIVFGELYYGDKRAPNLTVKVLDPRSASSLFEKNYPLEKKYAKGLLKPVFCHCESLCRDEYNVFIKDRILEKVDANNSCKLERKQMELLTLPDCKTEIMRQPYLTRKLKSVYSANKNCTRCGGSLPTASQLEIVRVCTPPNERGFEVPCSFDGASMNCFIGRDQVTPQSIGVKVKHFPQYQCKF